MANKKAQKNVEKSVFLLASNGTVEITEGDQTWTLRRPTIGELKTLRDSWLAIDSEQKRLVNALKEKEIDQAEVQEVVDKLTSDVINSLFATLGDPVAEYDDLPSYFQNPATIATILSHFQTIPLVRG